MCITATTAACAPSRPLKVPNIGLISYLATFARINEYGFVEAPYRPVDKATGKVLDDASSI